MWLMQNLLATLKDASREAFEMGGDGARDHYPRLRSRLRAIRARSRRLSIAGAWGFFSCAAALTAIPLLLDTAAFRTRVAAVVLGLLMVAAGVAAHEASRIVTLIDALEDLLFFDAKMSRLDIVMAFHDHLQAGVEVEPSWEPLVAILCKAYVTTASVQTRLLASRIPVGYLNLSQSAADLWRDALRAAYRSRQIEDLMTSVLADDSVSAYHARLRACRASLGV